MSNITYGAGVNLLLGSNVAIYESLLAKNSSATSKNALFTDGSFSLGKNVFEVGGNLLSSLFGDDRTSDGRFGGSTGQDVAKFITDMLTSSLLEGQLAFGEPVIAPGIHLMSGLTGGDTYKFSGLWGVAAVVEPPSVYAGVDLNFGYDTLDFSDVSGNMTYESTVLHRQHRRMAGTLNALGHPMPLSIGMNLVLARNDAGASGLNNWLR